MSFFKSASPQAAQLSVLHPSQDEGCFIFMKTFLSARAVAMAMMIYTVISCHIIYDINDPIWYTAKEAIHATAVV